MCRENPENLAKKKILQGLQGKFYLDYSDLFCPICEVLDQTAAKTLQKGVYECDRKKVVPVHASVVSGHLD